MTDFRTSPGLVDTFKCSMDCPGPGAVQAIGEDVREAGDKYFADPDNYITAELEEAGHEPPTVGRSIRVKGIDYRAFGN